MFVNNFVVFRPFAGRIAPAEHPMIERHRLRLLITLCLRWPIVYCVFVRANDGAGSFLKVITPACVDLKARLSDKTLDGQRL